MKKFGMLALAILAVVPLFSFARQGSDDFNDDHATRREDRQEDRREHMFENKGRACGEVRQEAHEEMQSHRDSMSDNWSSFREENEGIRQFFDELTDEEKDTVKEVLESAHDEIETIKKTAYATFKEDGESSVLDQAHDDIVAVWQEVFDDLQQRVDSGEESAYASRTADFLEMLATNKALRTTTAQTRRDMQEACYDKKSSMLITKLSARVDKLLEKVPEERQAELLEKLIEKVEQLIDKTAASNRPEEWTSARVALLETFVASLESLLDDVSSLEDDSTDLTEVE